MATRAEQVPLITRQECNIQEEERTTEQGGDRLHTSDTETNEAYTKSQKTDLNIVLVGVTGSGKSSLANALAGSEDGTAFKEKDTNKFCTEHAISKSSELHGRLRIWDSPGFLDGTNRDNQYLSEIKYVVKYFNVGDLMIFCLNANTVFKKCKESDDVKALLKIKKKFGAEIFKKVIIALTKADTIIGVKRFKEEGLKLQYYRDRIKNSKTIYKTY